MCPTVNVIRVFADFFYSTCILTLLLSFNRCLAVVAPRLCERLFAPGRLKYWLAAAFTYVAVYDLNCKPAVMNSAAVTWLFDPHFPYYINMDLVSEVKTFLWLKLAKIKKLLLF